MVRHPETQVQVGRSSEGLRWESARRLTWGAEPGGMCMCGRPGICGMPGGGGKPPCCCGRKPCGGRPPAKTYEDDQTHSG